MKELFKIAVSILAVLVTINSVSVEGNFLASLFLYFVFGFGLSHFVDFVFDPLFARYAKPVEAKQ